MGAPCSSARGRRRWRRALKLARQYHIERGEPQRGRIIARHFSYHGNTLGGTGDGRPRGTPGPVRPRCCSRRTISTPATPIAYSATTRRRRRSAGAWPTSWRRASFRSARGEVAAFVAEPVVGATLGTQPAARGYFARIREICDSYGVLLIADEGDVRHGPHGQRSSRWSRRACTPTSRRWPRASVPAISRSRAVLAAENVVAALSEGSGILWNGHTYMSHAVAAAGGLGGAALRRGQRPPGQCRGAGAPAPRGARRALRRLAACRRHSRARALPLDRARRGPARPRPPSTRGSRSRRASRRRPLHQV